MTHRAASRLVTNGGTTTSVTVLDHLQVAEAVTATKAQAHHVSARIVAVVVPVLPAGAGSHEDAVIRMAVACHSRVATRVTAVVTPGMIEEAIRFAMSAAKAQGLSLMALTSNICWTIITA